MDIIVFNGDPKTPHHPASQNLVGLRPSKPLRMAPMEIEGLAGRPMIENI